MRTESRVLLRTLHEPLLVRTGLRNWNRKTVPVGRSFIRFPTPESVFEAAVEDEDEDADVVWASAEDEPIKEVVLEFELDEAPISLSLSLSSLSCLII